MTHDTKWKIIYTSKIIVPIIVVILLFIGGINAGIVTFEALEKKLEGEITVTLTIHFNNDTVYSKNIKLPDNSTVYDLLLKAVEDNEIDVESTYWESFDSIVVDCITYNGVRYASDSNHYWAYYVNGEIGLKGADKEIIKDNDLIEWRFTEF